MVDECPMTEDCPGYDRDRRMCLLRPGDCEFSPAESEVVLIVEAPEVLAPNASAEAVSRARAPGA
jgi:hypothetical protein